MDKRTFIALMIMMVFLWFWGNYLAPVPTQTFDTLAVDSTLAVEPTLPTDATMDTSLIGGNTNSSNALLTLAPTTNCPDKIEIKTDLYSATIDLQGGIISSWYLTHYLSTQKLPVQMILDRDDKVGSIIVIQNKKAILLDDNCFVSDEFGPVTISGEQEHTLTLTLQFDSVSSLRRTYTFYGNRYHFDMNIELQNLDIEEYKVSWGKGIPFEAKDANEEKLFVGAAANFGKEYFNIKTNKFKKNPIDTLTGTNPNWAAVRNKYFLGAFLPQGEVEDDVVIWGDFDTLYAGVEISFPVRNGIPLGHPLVYAGPIHFDTLKSYNISLEKNVDTGGKVIRPISHVVLQLLKIGYKAIPNYGWVIIIFSILTKLVFWPLTSKQYKSMAKMQAIQPKVEELRKKYASDPQKLNTETMKLYKEEGVNPMGGCWPILIQMPFLWALFVVLRGAIDLRGAPFMFWISDLSRPDLLFEVGGIPIRLLPVLMSLTTLFQQQGMSGANPQQKLMGPMMTILFFFLFYNFPSGLVLYWWVNGLFDIVNRKVVTPTIQKVKDEEVIGEAPALPGRPLEPSKDKKRKQS